eukprot:IDg4118t1
MSSFTPEYATAALDLLSTAQARRNEELETYQEHPERSDSDDENDSESPILDSFYNGGGSLAILK